MRKFRVKSLPLKLFIFGYVIYLAWPWVASYSRSDEGSRESAQALTRALEVTPRTAPPSKTSPSISAQPVEGSALLVVRPKDSKRREKPEDPMAHAVPDPRDVSHLAHPSEERLPISVNDPAQILATLSDLPGLRDKQEALQRVSEACEEECPEEVRFELFGLFHRFATRGTELDRILARQAIDILRRNSAPSLELDRLAESVR